MCEPATLTLIAAGVSAVGAGVTGVMAYNQQQYQKKVALSNQSAENARIATQIDQNERDQQTLSRKYSALKGSQRASIAANGVDVAFGSAADTIGDTEMYQTEDTNALGRNGGNELRGIDMSAANFGAKSAAAQQASVGTAVATGFNVGSSIIGGLRDSSKISAARKG